MGDRLGIPGAVGFLFFFFFFLFFIFAGVAVRNRPSLFALEVEFKRLTAANIRVLANYFLFCVQYRGRARTQVPTTRNYTLELPTFGVIAGVNPIEVQ